MGKKIRESITGHSCPECGLICNKKSFVSKTESVLDEDGVTFLWDETHRCKGCKTPYLIHNGSS